MATQIKVYENIAIVTFPNVQSSEYAKFSSDVFSRAASAGINIDMITQSPGVRENLHLAFTFADEDMPKLLAISNELALKKSSAPMVNVGNIKIVIKSDEMVNEVGFAAKVFDALSKVDCLPLLITTAVDEISLLVQECFCADLVNQMEKEFGA